MDAQTGDFHPWELAGEGLGLDLGGEFGQGVRVGRVARVILVDGEIGQLELLRAVGQPDGVDARGVAHPLDAHLGRGAHTVEGAVDAVLVDLPVGFAQGVGHRGEVDDGVAVFEGSDGGFVVGRGVGGAHF